MRCLALFVFHPKLTAFSLQSRSGSTRSGGAAYLLWVRKPPLLHPASANLAPFDSGQTRPNSDLTEGLSYARLAKLGNIYEQFMDEEQRHKNAGEFERVTTEVRRVRRAGIEQPC